MATEKRLIEANALLINIDCCSFETSADWWTVVEQINEAPTVDAVEVVRCKDCVWCEHGKSYAPYCNHPTDGMHDVQLDDFCSYGERKEGE